MITLATFGNYVVRIVIAAVIFFAGKYVVDWLVEKLEKSEKFAQLDGTVRTFTLSFIRIALYVVLAIVVVSIIGIPMASVIAVLASAGVTVGLALQGALANLAGGIMVLIFKPFKVGDYIETNGVQGICTDITLFYTKLLTLDNKRVTVPNGTLMNANVTDYSAEELRRVDLTFTTAKSEEPARVQQVMLDAMKKVDKVLADPAPFARLSGGTNDSMEFTARAWCKTEDYWDVYFDVTQAIVEAFGQNSVGAPVIRIAQINK